MWMMKAFIRGLLCSLGRLGKAPLDSVKVGKNGYSNCGVMGYSECDKMGVLAFADTDRCL